MKSPLPLPLPLPMPLPMRPVGWNSGLELESPSGISICYLGLILMLGMLDVGDDLHQKKIQQTQNPKNRASLDHPRDQDQAGQWAYYARSFWLYHQGHSEMGIVSLVSNSNLLRCA